MNVRIEIDTKTFVRFWLVVIGFAVAAIILYSARTALVIIGSALFLALALNGPVTKLAKLLPGKSRVGATAISFIGVILVLASFIFLVIPPIAQQTSRFIDTIPSLFEGADSRWVGIQDVINRYDLQDQLDQASQSVKGRATAWAASIGQGLIGGITSVVSFAAAAFIAVVAAFLMLIEGPMWSRRVWGLYNDEKRMKRHQGIVKRMHQVVNGYVNGALIVSTIGSLAAGLSVFVLSLVFPGALAELVIPTIAISFLFSLIPMFGATIGGLIITSLIALNNVPAGIAYFVFFVIYQQIENNFIVPRIQSKTVDLSALTVLVAVTIGIYMFGLAGGIISIPIAGSIRVLVEEYTARAKEKNRDGKKPNAKLVKLD